MFWEGNRYFFIDCGLEVRGSLVLSFGGWDWCFGYVFLLFDWVILCMGAY